MGRRGRFGGGVIGLDLIELGWVVVVAGRLQLVRLTKLSDWQEELGAKCAYGRKATYIFHRFRNP